MKPATPLPWHLDERSICGWLERGGVVKDVETTVAEVFTGENMDAAYIVHACNNFPRLVDALRQMTGAMNQLGKGHHGDVVAAEALLRELGEDHV